MSEFVELIDNEERLREVLENPGGKFRSTIVHFHHDLCNKFLICLFYLN